MAATSSIVSEECTGPLHVLPGLRQVSRHAGPPRPFDAEGDRAKKATTTTPANRPGPVSGQANPLTSTDVLSFVAAVA